MVVSLPKYTYAYYVTVWLPFYSRLCTRKRFTYNLYPKNKSLDILSNSGDLLGKND